MDYLKLKETLSAKLDEIRKICVEELDSMVSKFKKCATYQAQVGDCSEYAFKLNRPLWISENCMNADMVKYLENGDGQKAWIVAGHYTSGGEGSASIKLLEDLETLVSITVAISKFIEERMPESAYEKVCKMFVEMCNSKSKK